MPTIDLAYHGGLFLGVQVAKAFLYALAVAIVWKTKNTEYANALRAYGGHGDNERITLEDEWEVGE